MKQLFFALSLFCVTNLNAQQNQFAELCGQSDMVPFLTSLTTVSKADALQILKKAGYTIKSQEKFSNVEIIATRCKLSKGDIKEFPGTKIIVYDNHGVDYFTVNWWEIRQAKALYVGDKIDGQSDDDNWVHYKKNNVLYTFWNSSVKGYSQPDLPADVEFFKLEVRNQNKF